MKYTKQRRVALGAAIAVRVVVVPLDMRAHHMLNAPTYLDEPRIQTLVRLHQLVMQGWHHQTIYALT